MWVSSKNINILSSLILLFLSVLARGSHQVLEEHMGLAYVYRQTVEISPSECIKNLAWTFVSEAQCDIFLSEDRSNIPIFVRTRFIYSWRYLDDPFSLLINISHTDFGYRIKFLGSVIGSEGRFEPEVLKKYLTTALGERGLNTDELYTFGPKKASIKASILGRATVIEKKFTHKNKMAFIENCLARWNGKSCTVGLLSVGTQEVLISGKTFEKTVSIEDKGTGSVTFKASGREGWRFGSAGSFYNLQFQLSEQETNLQKVKKYIQFYFSKVQPEVKIKVQSIEVHGQSSQLYESRFLDYLSLVKKNISLDFDLCETSYLYSNIDGRGECLFEEAQPSFLISNPKIFAKSLDINKGAIPYVHLQVVPEGYHFSIWAPKEIVGLPAGAKPYFLEALKQGPSHSQKKFFLEYASSRPYQ